MHEVMALIVIFDPGALLLLVAVAFFLALATTLPLMRPIVRWKTLWVFGALWLSWMVVAFVFLQVLRGQRLIALESVVLP